MEGGAHRGGAGELNPRTFQHFLNSLQVVTGMGGIFKTLKNVLVERINWIRYPKKTFVLIDLL